MIVLAETLLALGSARATDYLNNQNPACRTMCNSFAGAPFRRSRTAMKRARPPEMDRLGFRPRDPSRSIMSVFSF